MDGDRARAARAARRRSSRATSASCFGASTAYGRDVTRPYVRALEARHSPHVLVKGGSFNEREEVEAIAQRARRDRAAR